MSVALITGANRGLGRAVAEELATRGVTVVVGARNLEDGAQVAQAIGRGATAVQLDVTNPESVRSAVGTVSRDHGGLDILVNNAGVLPEATAAEQAEVVDPELFSQTFAINVFGPVEVTAAFLPLLRRSSQGRIVNVSTTMGSLNEQLNPESPYYGMVVPAYQSSKAALNGVTLALAKALADTPIKVTSVCPGFVQTDLTPVNREQAPLTPREAAQVVVQAATLPSEAKSGTFIDANGEVAW